MVKKLPEIYHSPLLAYIVGIALGDGNLSNPNGRATRLRITCDLKYLKLIQKIQASLAILLPQNKVSIVKRPEKCIDLSCYSNKWKNILEWSANKGSKLIQGVPVPNWIKINHEYEINCLRGLIETDGSIYSDRKYRAVMLTNASYNLAKDVFQIMISLGFRPRFYTLSNGGDRIIYRVRVATNVDTFLELIKPEKK